MRIQNALLVGITGFCHFGPGPASARGLEKSRGTQHSFILHERHDQGHLEGWVKRGNADSDSMLPMRIGLRQSNLEAGHDLLMDISNPQSPNYGKHLSRDEVIEFFAPQNHSVEQVKRWLLSAGIHEGRLSQSENKQWIQFDAPVKEVEGLLLTKYHVFEHLETGVQNVACSEYHVPRHLSKHIDYITPGIRLSTGHYDDRVTKRMQVDRRDRKWEWPERGGNGKGNGKGNEKPKPPQQDSEQEEESHFRVTGPCNEEVTAHCIRAQYRIPEGRRARWGNELGVFQSLSQHYSQEDLDTYWKYISPWVPKGTHPELRSINGAYGPTNDTALAGEEANLDFQVAIPLIWPQKTVLFQTDDEWYQQDQTRPDTRYTGFFNTFFDGLDGSYCSLTAFNQTGNCLDPSCRDPEYPNPNADPAFEGAYHGALMCGAHRPTHVLSVSYSGTEHSWPANYMRRQCFEVMKLALQGITVVESSGDFGVGGRRFDSRAGCLGEGRDVYAPRTMGNCPYVLSVGATALVEVGKQGGGRFAETAASAFASGGGFSNVFPRPPWQDRHVLGYLQRADLEEKGYVNAAGRNYSEIRPEPGKLFNKAGRGYPDVAAIGENFRVVLRGYPNRMHGTSVAAPIWASILTLINEERLAVGKRPVGFVHQVLYAHPEVFTDIKNGSNPGCGGEGFPAKEGWDPVTGLGTPIYPKLRDLFLRLP